MPDEPEATLDAQVGALAQQTGIDHFQTLVTAALSAVPVVGGPLAVLLTEYVPMSRQERLQDLIRRLADDIGALGDQINAEYVRTDTFAELFETTMAAAARSSEAEKRAAFAALLANALTDARPSEEESLLFLDILQDCRTLHLRLLAVIRTTTSTADDKMQTFSMSSIMTTLREKMPDYSDELLTLAWGDLSDWGFLNTDARSLKTTMSLDGARSLAGRLTGLGQRFVANVTSE